MTMRKFTFLLALLVLLVTACSWREANTLPTKHSTQKALLFYKNEEAKGNGTTELYNNIGRLYLALKKPSYAMLYFEKGLALSPLNTQLLTNREKALALCDASVMANNSNFYERKYFFIKVLERINILLTAILLGSFMVYFGFAKSRYRMIIRKRCKTTALSSVVLLLLVYGIYQKSQFQSYAILKSKTAIHNGPSTKAHIIQRWSEGCQVKIVKTYKNWAKIETFNQQSGWVFKEDLLNLPE